MMALLQPSPEVFQLFDDIMLLSDGMCVYFGPREGVLPLFESQGFRCPPRMPVPGFLQNITSRRDQQVCHISSHYQAALVTHFLSSTCSALAGMAMRQAWSKEDILSACRI